jgi:hypothetical protein
METISMRVKTILGMIFEQLQVPLRKLGNRKDNL